MSERPRGAGYWKPVQVGSVFRQEDWVRTGELSFARVEFVAGGVLELESKTIVVIEQPPSKTPGEVAGPRVALREGSVRGILPAASEAQHPVAPLRLRAPDGRELVLAPTTGKQTEFRVEQRDGKTEIAVLDGAARIGTESGDRSLVAGQFASVGRDAPGRPEELLAYPSSQSPGVDARFHGSPTLAIPLRWEVVAQAKSYRLQVARDLSFQQLVVDEDVSTATYLFRPGTMGMFAWRVASGDRDGRFGEFGFARRVFVELVEPRERLIEPAANAVLKLHPEDGVSFRWEPGDKGDRYHWVLARTADLLRSQVAAQIVTSPSANLESVDPGEYFWGVYVEQEDGQLQPIFLSSRRLEVKRAGKVTVLAPSAIRNWGE